MTTFENFFIETLKCVGIKKNETSKKENVHELDDELSFAEFEEVIKKLSWCKIPDTRRAYLSILKPLHDENKKTLYNLIKE